MNEILKRLLTQFGDTELVEKFSTLSNSDFNSLMLEIFQSRVNKITPADMVKAFQVNRFSVPSKLDPVAYHVMEAEFLSAAEKLDVKPVLLSPAAPFASSSVFGYVSQNNVASAVRGVEILPDPTNMLSIMIAEQLKNKKVDNTKPIHYCTTARVLRAQTIPKTNRHFAHFGQFCIVSSGKDTGSYTCEKELLIKQLAFYKELLWEKYGANLSVILQKRRGYTDGDGFFDVVAELVKNELPDGSLSFDMEYGNSDYYKGISFIVYMEKNGDRLEIGGGGFVDWIQRLTNNKKERCLINGVGLDRLLL